MSTLSTDRTTYLVRGNSLKAIQSAGSLGGRPFGIALDNTYAGLGGSSEASAYAFFGRTPKDKPEDQAAVANGANLTRFRNTVAAVLIASTAMISCEPVTAMELPEVHQSARELPSPHKDHEVENFLDPLVFDWDEDRFVVSEAIRNELAEFNADH